MKFKEGYMPENINKFLDLSNKKRFIEYNGSFIQKPMYAKCGLFCMKYIRERNKSIFL